MKTKVVIELEIEGKPEDATFVVDSVLDLGVLQDAINEHECSSGHVRVTSAVWRGYDEAKDSGVST